MAAGLGVKADVRRRLEIAMANTGRAIDDRVLTEELSEMLRPLGVKEERMAAAMMALGIKSVSHGRRLGHRIASVSVAEAEKIIGWLLSTRRGH